jgi:hypothetical protein
VETSRLQIFGLYFCVMQSMGVPHTNVQQDYGQVLGYRAMHAPVGDMRMKERGERSHATISSSHVEPVGNTTCFPYIRVLDDEQASVCYQTVRTPVVDSLTCKRAKGFHLISRSHIETMRRLATQEPAVTAAIRAICIHPMLSSASIVAPPFGTDDTRERLVSIYDNLVKDIIHSFIVYGIAIVRFLSDDSLLYIPRVMEITECEVGFAVSSFGKRSYRVYVNSLYCPDAIVYEHTAVTIDGRSESSINALLLPWFSLRKNRYIAEINNIIRHTPYMTAHTEEKKETPISDRFKKGPLPAKTAERYYDQYTEQQDGMLVEARREHEPIVSAESLHEYTIFSVRDGSRVSMNTTPSSASDLAQDEIRFESQVNRTLQTYNKVEQTTRKSNATTTEQERPLYRTAKYWLRVGSRTASALLYMLYGAQTIMPLSKQANYLLRTYIQGHYDLNYFMVSRLLNYFGDDLCAISPDLCARHIRRISLQFSLKLEAELVLEKCTSSDLCQTRINDSEQYNYTRELSWQVLRSEPPDKQIRRLVTFFVAPDPKQLPPAENTKDGHYVISQTDRMLLERICKLMRLFRAWKLEERTLRFASFTRFLYTNLWQRLYMLTDQQIQAYATLYFRETVPSVVNEYASLVESKQLINLKYPNLCIAELQADALLIEQETQARLNLEALITQKRENLLKLENPQKGKRQRVDFTLTGKQNLDNVESRFGHKQNLNNVEPHLVDTRPPNPSAMNSMNSPRSRHFADTEGEVNVGTEPIEENRSSDEKRSSTGKRRDNVVDLSECGSVRARGLTYDTNIHSD